MEDRPGDGRPSSGKGDSGIKAQVEEKLFDVRFGETEPKRRADVIADSPFCAHNR